MIARRLRLNDPSKSSMVRLVNYLTDSQGVDNRVGETRITNCDSDDPQWAALEMQAVQKQNHRAKGDKTYHLVLSFNETPDSATLKKIENYVCKDLGYAEHQRFSVMHHDTDHPHLHIAINKIHPRKHTMNEPYYDEQKLAKICKFLERYYGLQPDNHEPHAQAAETGATNMENAGDLESLTGWIRRNCLEGINQAQTWEEVHAVLSKHGLTMHERGNGLVISSDDIHVKASSVDRRLSKRRLEERLGAFVAKGGKRAGKPKKAYARKPMGKKHELLWSQYNQWSASNDEERKTALLQARQERDAAMKELRRTSDLKYAVIKYAVSDPAMRRFLMRLNRMRLRRKAQKLREAYARQRQDVLQLHRHATWSTWLAKEAAADNAEALAYLHARKQSVTRGGTLGGLDRKGKRPAVQKVTRHGTFIYAEGKERKQRILVDGHANDSDLAKGLELASQLFGSRLVVEGPPEFMNRVAQFAGATKMKVSFVDGQLEAQRQAAEKGEQANPGRARRR